MITDTMAKNISVKINPEIYIINQQGKVAFAQCGYSKDLYAKMDKIIGELLK